MNADELGAGSSTNTAVFVSGHYPDPPKPPKPHGDKGKKGKHGKHRHH
jgi:hypothetical protein